MTTTGPQRPNYFELLELDPDTPWSEAAFLAQLDRKKAEWTRGRNHPKHALRFKSYLDMVPDIQATLADPARRAAEQESARTLLTSKAADTQARFTAELELRAAKGFFTRAEVAALLKEYGPALGESAVQEAVNALALPIRHEEASVPQRETLDSATMTAISGNLAIVGEETLYSFLGLARTTRTSDLYERAAEIYADNQKQATKTAIVTARSDLAGQAMKVFASDDMRRKYDGALADGVFAALGEDIARVTQGSRTLHPAQYQKLLERAREQGLDLAEAEGYIRRRAQELQVALYVTDTAPIARRQRCPSCGTLAGESAANCPSCGTPLRITCPNCQRQMPTANLACTACGFPIGNLANVEALLAEAQALFEARDLEAAARTVQTARRQWSPAGITSALSDPLSKALISLQEQVAAARQEEAGLLSALQRQIDERQFYAARAALREIERALPTAEVSAQRAAIEAAITRAEAALRRARQLEAQGEDVVELYRRILWECSDCQVAREALAHTPPAPPGALTVRAGNRVARLEWEPSPARSVEYRVVRKAGAPPIAAGDGEMIATTTGTIVDDTAVPVGLPVYYAVYASREGVLSTEPARAERPLLFTADVEALSAQVDSGLVRLRWQPPPNATGIEVRRGDDTPPATPEEGVRLRVFGGADAVDSGLENGRTYHYTVFALFGAPEGRQVRSGGVSVSATPQEPPALITALDIQTRQRGPGRELRVSWPPLTKGEGVLLHSPEPPPLHAGQVIPQDALATYGEVSPAPRNTVSLPLPGSGVLYLTPAVLFQAMAYLGPTQRFTALEDARNLQVRNLGFALELRWDWPEGCNFAVVAHHPAHFPGPEDPDAARIRLTRAEYAAQGRCLIRDPQPRDHFIAVFAGLAQDGQELLAPGREPTSRARITLSSRITLSYTVSQPRRLLGRGSRTLTLTAEGAGLLPELVVIRRPDALPIRRDDGAPILHIPAQQLDNPQTTLTFTLDADEGYFRLFLADDAGYEARGGHIRLLLPRDAALDAGRPPARPAHEPHEVTCPFCFTRFSAGEALFRCANPRCPGRVDDEIYASYQGLVDAQSMGRVFSLETPPEGRRARSRPALAAPCPDCAQETHKRVCPTCHYDLLYDVGLTEERTIAILGGRGTGKSNYIAMLINRLENEIGAQFGAGVRAMGDRTRERYERDFYTPLFRRHQVIPPTRTAGVDLATRTPLVFRITFGSGKVVNLVFFDTAGEDMQSLDAISTEARYLLFADALIFLMDPLQIPAVRQLVPPALVPPADPGAEPEYIIGRLRELYEQEFGLRARQRISKPVAFTLSKVDMLYPLLDPGSGLFRTGEHFDALNTRDLDSIHAEIGAILRAWLGQRFETLVRTNFSNYHYFGVSSFGKPPEGPSGRQTIESAAPIRVEDPILWIFHAFGLIKAR